MTVFIIAEAGVNHNGSIETAREMIFVAKEAGADGVKFQTAVPDLVATPHVPKAAYQSRTTTSSESQLDMLRMLHFPLDRYGELKIHCEKQGIEFMSTAFDEVSLEALSRLDLERIKIPSGEITNLPYLRHVARMGKPVVMSTGMATLAEVSAAMEVLLGGGIEKEDLTILHCNTDYPTPMTDVNLQAMLTIRDELGVKVGYSDHTLGIEVPIAAVAMGATVVEKHFTLDRRMQGPDHAASLEPHELRSMVVAIRNIEKALGDGVKIPSNSELENIAVVRKSIVAKRAIYQGDLFSDENLAVKRPGTGISPMLWDKVLGHRAERDYAKDDSIDL